VKSNIKSRPAHDRARMRLRGARAWSGAVKDQITISHGTIAAASTPGGRRNYYTARPGSTPSAHATFTDFQEKNIATEATRARSGDQELHGLFRSAEASASCRSAPVGLIGDDIEAVAKRLAKEINIPYRAGAVRRLPGRVPGPWATISRTDTIKDHVLGQGTPRKTTPYDVNLNRRLQTSAAMPGPRARSWRRRASGVIASIRATRRSTRSGSSSKAK